MPKLPVYETQILANEFRNFEKKILRILCDFIENMNYLRKSKLKKV